MPFVNIWMREGKTAEHKRAVSDAIHRAMRDVLKVTEDDRFHQIHEQSAEDMIQDRVYAGIPRSGDSVFVQLYFPKRPTEMKLRLFDQIVDNLAGLADIDPNDVYLNAIEPDPVNWWISGREVDPETGFDRRMGSAAAEAAGQ